MSELPNCRLCGSEPAKGSFEQFYHPHNPECSLTSRHFTEQEWRTLMHSPSDCARCAELEAKLSRQQEVKSKLRDLEAQLQGEVNSLEAENAQQKERIAAMKMAGGLLANIAFNLKQSESVTPEHRELLANAQEHWDKATREPAPQGESDE